MIGAFFPECFIKNKFIQWKNKSAMPGEDKNKNKLSHIVYHSTVSYFEIYLILHEKVIICNFRSDSKIT